MLLLKKIDVYGQICLIAITLICKWEVRRVTIFDIYYTVGLWQSISTFVHFIFKEGLLLLNQRKYYQILRLRLLGAKKPLGNSYKSLASRLCFKYPLLEDALKEIIGKTPRKNCHLF